MKKNLRRILQIVAGVGHFHIRRRNDFRVGWAWGRVEGQRAVARHYFECDTSVEMRRGAETTIRKRERKIDRERKRADAPKAGLFSNDDDNVALERRQPCHRWASLAPFANCGKRHRGIITVRITLMAMIFQRSCSMMRGKSWRKGIGENEEKFASAIYLKINMLEEHRLFTNRYT